MNDLPDPFLLIVGLTLLGLVPFLAVMATSFVKLVVVLGLIRNALGIQQIPPNMALHALAIVLTLYIMAPAFTSAYHSLAGEDLGAMDTHQILEALGTATEPFRSFLERHSHEHEKAFFVSTAQSLWPEEYAKDVSETDYMVLLPAFTVSELTSAFEIGFLLYLPFIAIDLIISNILLAMGMMMVSPMTISLPFKLLLFVLIDGWSRLIHGLIMTYQ